MKAILNKETEVSPSCSRCGKNLKVVKQSARTEFEDRSYCSKSCLELDAPEAAKRSSCSPRLSRSTN